MSGRGNLPRVEPGADQRQAALSLRQLYVALVESGFTETQALTLVGEAVAAVVGRAAPGDGD